jgi:DNA-binding NarL/FixJ family response regulator
MSVRIVVVDDHAVVREGIQALLSAIEDFDLVGDADDAASAVRAAVTLAPDVILMDVGLPERSGIDAAREITRVAPEVRVLMLTMFDDDESVFSAIRAGALGYVLKGARPEQLVRAIHAVADGEAILGPGVARTALAYLTTPRSD